jgi:2-polyprenyl-3-methyl-5-hydroxy-6-metoxy-1,4-benzoquinol methylase
MDTQVDNPMTGYGWLNRRDDIVRDDSWFGVHLQATLPTRWEEFDFAWTVAKGLPVGRALDAGTGVTWYQHILPMILGPMGWRVTAIDSDPVTLEMPSHPNVERYHQNMLQTPFDSASFDAVFCISTLEHIGGAERETFLREADRLLKPGGTLCLTMDELDPAWFVERLNGYDCGKEVPRGGPMLCPAVSYLVARKND